MRKLIKYYCFVRQISGEGARKEKIRRRKAGIESMRKAN